MEPSLALLIACCRNALGDTASGELAERLRQADGERLAELARRHRVELPVWRTLRQLRLIVPGTAALGMEAMRLASDGGRLAQESGRLNRHFASASLPHLFLGGPALAGMAWRDPSLTHEAVIQLLVTPAAVGKAAAQLSLLGYVQEEPDPSVDTADWHRSRRRSCWRSDDGVILHLSTRLADNPFVLSGLGATTPPNLVQVSQDVALPTLPPALQIAAIAVEGCAAAWPRLAQLADLAALVRRLPSDLLAQAVERCARLGAERPVSAALVLSHRLFGTALPNELWFDGGAARLVKLGLAEIGDPRRPEERRFPGLRGARARTLLLPGSRFLIGDALRQLGSALTR
jgi:hypothetical protein